MQNPVATTNRVVGSVLLLLGLAAAGLGGWLMSETPDYQPANEQFRTTLEQQCRNTLNGMNTLAKRIQADKITVQGGSLNSADSAYNALAQASIILQGCPGYQIESFCFGNGCGRTPLMMTLTQKKAK